MSERSQIEAPQVGQQIRFLGDKRWWTVRAADERWSIAVRQADFRPRGVLLYTIIDATEGIRGACNLIGQGWGDGSYSVAECENLLRALQLGATPLPDRGWPVVERDAAGAPISWACDETEVEISRRNYVSCDLTRCLTRRVSA